MHTKKLTIMPVTWADDGYYITPDGMVLKVIPTHMRGKYKWAGVRRNGRQKSFAVHRMVAASYVPNPENKPQVNHKNGDKLDNRAENLEWVTSGENTRHAHSLGLVGHRHQPVDMLDAEGRLLRTFNSEREAADFLQKKSTCRISSCVSGQQETAYGYRWRKRNKT